MVDIFDFAEAHNVDVRVSYEAKTGMYIIRLSRGTSNAEVELPSEEYHSGYPKPIDFVLYDLLYKLEREYKAHQELISDWMRRRGEKIEHE